PETVAFELKRGDEVISKGQRSLASGMNRLTFRDRATQVGNQAYTLSVFPIDKAGKVKDTDPVPENNTARFLVGVSGPRPILHVTQSEDSGLARLLAKGGLNVRPVPPNAVRWTLE